MHGMMHVAVVAMQAELARLAEERDRAAGEGAYALQLEAELRVSG